MHEIGVVIEVIKKVERFANLNAVTEVDTLVLQIGELSSMIPRYVEACFPAAIQGTILEKAELRIEVIPANAICKDCQSVYNVIEHKKLCPKCNGDRAELLSGREFIIKEIIAF